MVKLENFHLGDIVQQNVAPLWANIETAQLELLRAKHHHIYHEVKTHVTPLLWSSPISLLRLSSAAMYPPSPPAFPFGVVPTNSGPAPAQLSTSECYLYKAGAFMLPLERHFTATSPVEGSGTPASDHLEWDRIHWLVLFAMIGWVGLRENYSHSSLFVLTHPKPQERNATMFQALLQYDCSWASQDSLQRLQNSAADCERCMGGC